MINFRKPLISDKEWVDRLLAESGYRGCEYNFTNIYVWQDLYDIKIAEFDKQLIINLTGPVGNCYNFPAGVGDMSNALLEMKKDAEEKNQPFKLVCLTNGSIEFIDKLFPGHFKFTEDRAGFDYIYRIDKLADLNGKELHPKRTHINRFIENNSGWVFEIITPDNIKECLDMHNEWIRLNGEGESTGMASEDLAVRKAFDNYFDLKLEGALLRSEGRVIAFTIGDRINKDTYDIHFEEALKDVRGSYTMINREFARYIKTKHPDIVYMNREDDLGIEDLRKAKNSYYPEILLEKLTAVYIS